MMMGLFKNPDEIFSRIGLSSVGTFVRQLKNRGGEIREGDISRKTTTYKRGRGRR